MTHADAGYYHSQAHGPQDLHPVIAGMQVSVINLGDHWVTVVDDRGGFHDFRGVTWPEIVEIMSERIEAMRGGAA